MGKNLLIVERDPLYRFVAASLLQRAGYGTTKAGDNREALMIVSQAADSGRRFDLVLTDTSIRDVSGIVFLSEMKKGNCEIPVCAFSESRDMDLINELLHIGCDGIITKPFEPEQLVSFVDDIFNNPP